MRILFSVLCLFFASNLMIAQSDNCRPFVPVAVGTSWEVQHYNAKDKVQGSNTFELIDLKKEGNATTFTIETKSFDKNGEEIYSHTYQAYCEDGQFQVDMEQFLNGATLEAYQDMEINVDGSNFEIPDFDAPIGTTMPDGTLDVAIDMGTGMNINMNVVVTDREITAREQVSTPAGDFDCVVFSQTMQTKMLVKVEGRSKEWYAPEIGVVRSESYNRKGKLTGYSELTRVTYP